MSVCRIYLHAGSVIALHGSGFRATWGKLEGDLRSVDWEELDTKRSDPLYLDASQVAAVVVSDK